MPDCLVTLDLTARYPMQQRFGENASEADMRVTLNIERWVAQWLTFSYYASGLRVALALHPEFP